MHPHVFRHGGLSLESGAAQLALEPALRLVHGHVLLELRADAEVLPADFALVLIGEVHRVLVPEKCHDITGLGKILMKVYSVRYFSTKDA